MSTYQAILDCVRLARTEFEANRFETAAHAYQKASRLMTNYAKEAVAREEEQYRKNKALEYREKAQSLLARAQRPDEKPLAEKEPAAARQDPLRDIVSSFYAAPQVSWDDIGGLEDVKRELRFTLALSLASAPAGVRLPTWRNLLFYGPPGTGKTLLAAATAKAIADLATDQCAFFNVKVSSVLSKYFGESAKIISELYAAARSASPSVVFFDEFESLTPDRESEESGPAWRILSTILAEMDGLAEKGRNAYVLTIAATNLPWKMDQAILSRFEKRVLIPPPDLPARERMLRVLVEKPGFMFDGDYEELARHTEGYTGRELEQICKRALNNMILEQNAELPSYLDGQLESLRAHKIALRALRADDFRPLLKDMTPSVTPKIMAPFLAYQAGQEF